MIVDIIWNLFKLSILVLAVFWLRPDWATYSYDQLSEWWSAAHEVPAVQSCLGRASQRVQLFLGGSGQLAPEAGHCHEASCAAVCAKLDRARPEAAAQWKEAG
eukprot:CAMPEP_0179171112 /NCGR_PEP_ID=MMETSP0796-20121207/84333_1 /TAXON_ID=73915 /ORGANISM="Pyrodinium bahamense, Strain pbaha01" /LENGTH=102 /DNA_ID=CAMNT_0020874155 /DNA_START=519 /DNA_END=823 /DNA_ORIENTATION=+